MNSKIIGNKIAKYRKIHNLTQDDLAEKLLITPQAVSRWENGHTLPETSILMDLCRFLQISVDELLSDREDRRTSREEIPDELRDVQKLWDSISNNWYQRYRSKEIIDRIVNDPSSAFHPTVWNRIKEVFPSLKGKKICVPSSGDNHAVFAFAVLGAKVTSCDISEQQLGNASKIAEEYNWNIEFICDDTRHLLKLTSETYDFVYTSNGVHVWIDDLDSMYKSIYRILKKNGSIIMYDVHPFLRPFDDSKLTLKILKPYDWTGPFEDDDDGVPNGVMTYTWRMQDLCNSIIKSGLQVIRLEEMYAEYGTFWFVRRDDEYYISKEEKDRCADWKTNPYAALPQWLMIQATK
jgi:transcriptional regulator with XRE-family HTH domain